MLIPRTTTLIPRTNVSQIAIDVDPKNKRVTNLLQRS
jgi:hypothetical protein